MTITEERQEQVDFTEPYFSATQAVVVLKGNDSIKTLEDLQGKKAAVQDGTTGHFMAADDLGCDVSDTVYKFSSDAALDVVNGRADCMIIDDAVAQNFLKLYDELTIVEGLDMPVEEYGIARQQGAGRTARQPQRRAGRRDRGWNVRRADRQIFPIISLYNLLSAAREGGGIFCPALRRRPL